MGVEFQVTMWVLEMEPRSFGGAANALNCRAIYSPPKFKSKPLNVTFDLQFSVVEMCPFAEWLTLLCVLRYLQRH